VKHHLIAGNSIKIPSAKTKRTSSSRFIASHQPDHQEQHLTVHSPVHLSTRRPGAQRASQHAPGAGESNRSRRDTFHRHNCTCEKSRLRCTAALGVAHRASSTASHRARPGAPHTFFFPAPPCADARGAGAAPGHSSAWACSAPDQDRGRWKNEGGEWEEEEEGGREGVCA